LTASQRGRVREAPQEQRVLGQGAQLPEEPLLEVLLLEGPQQAEQEARQVVRQEAPEERPREPEVPPPREEPRARVPAAQLLGQVQGRELLRREPELRVLLRRYRHRLEPAQRPPQRCRLRRPKFLQ